MREMMHNSNDTTDAQIQSKTGRKERKGKGKNRNEKKDEKGKERKDNVRKGNQKT